MSTWTQIRSALRGGLIIVAVAATVPIGSSSAQPAVSSAPTASPLLAASKPVDWWFVFKFGVGTAPTQLPIQSRPCPFGGTAQAYAKGFSQHYIVASSIAPTLVEGGDLLGATLNDPVGATFNEIYGGRMSYVIWNDQFYNEPTIAGCKTFCDDPWAHSKGVMAWNDQGEGVVMQVTTPDWPGSGDPQFGRPQQGNTLGCGGDNNVKVAQHFFSLRLTKDDTANVLKALANAGVVTLPNNKQVVSVRPQSPADLKALAMSLGSKNPPNPSAMDLTLSSGIKLISKPAALRVPPWQFVSALLGGEPLRTATWWTGDDAFPSTRAVKPRCWDRSLGTPGEVEIAMTGMWGQKHIGLAGGSNPNGNHAKIGVSLPGGHGYTIFGDMNQTGGLASACTASQNPRGGLFFVVNDPGLHDSVAALLTGTTAAFGTKTVSEGATRWTSNSSTNH